MGQIWAYRGILQALCVYNSIKGVIHNEMARFQTSLHDKAGTKNEHMAEDKKSVFIALFLFCTKTIHIFYATFTKYVNNVKSAWNYVINVI